MQNINGDQASSVVLSADTPMRDSFK